MIVTGISEKYDSKNNFWELNPAFKAYYPFSEFYGKDNSKSKGKSSTIMWAIALIHDPDSPFFNREEESRVEQVAKGLLADKDYFKSNDYNRYLEEFRNLTLTPNRRSYLILSKKLKERNDFLDTLVYTEENIKIIDDALLKNDKLFKQLDDLETLLGGERDEDQGLGGHTYSESDTGAL